MALKRSPETGPQTTLRAGLPDRYLTPDDVAEILGVPVETLYQWRKKRTGPPGFRIGKHTRYDPADLYAWIADQKRLDISQAA
ncbi:helix-turn-helix transcriptional regulator [Streptomyces sp. NPDC090231]|uniref:helix-turn-helix transcriptional regulator n=1 Tax=unclassified Streptomyces TaxID=2593676 RepID=UPI0037F39BD5